MTSFPIAKVGEIAPGNMVGIEAGGERILLANIGGAFYAMRAKCNHMGGQLDKGTLEGEIVTCPLHGSKWDVKTGKLVQFTRPLSPERVFEVVVDGDQVSVEV